MIIPSSVLSDLKTSSLGQATVEYLFVILFTIMISLKIVQVFTDFMRDSMGNLGHVLSTHLNVGICEKNCFFGGYKNGPGE
jgi:hypothetical protein